MTRKALTKLVSRGSGGSLASRKVKTGAAALGSVREWCHNFDLTKAIPVQELSSAKLVRCCLFVCPRVGALASGMLHLAAVQ